MTVSNLVCYIDVCGGYLKQKYMELCRATLETNVSRQVKEAAAAGYCADYGASFLGESSKLASMIDSMLPDLEVC